MDESIEHQDARGRREFHFRAALLAAVVAGAVTFVMSGGAPWTTAGTMNAVMGRHFDFPLPVLALLHLLVSVVYATIISLAIYRMKIVGSLLVGLGTGLALYALNFMLFSGMTAHEGGNVEVQALGAHFTFSLLAAALYRATAVPRRRVDPAGSRTA